mgnify:CR=1 FL=1
MLQRLLPLLLVFGVSAPLQARKPPEFPPPPAARVQSMGGSTVVGGRAMEIRQFSSSDDPERVYEFYRRLWKEDENGYTPGYGETDAMSPWHILSRVEEGYLMTVQAQPVDGKGTWGYLALSRVDEVPAAPPDTAGVPKMSGSQILQNITSRDPGQSGATILLTNRHSLASNVNYYRQQFQAGDWRPDMDKAIPKAKMHVLSYTGGRRKIAIVLTGDDKETQVVINDVHHDIL